MSEFNYNRNYDAMRYDAGSMAVSETALIKNVYMWMAGALTVTGLVAYYVAGSYEMMNLIFGNRFAFYGLIIAELGLVLGLNFAINKISAVTATIMFLLYAVINGATMASIFFIYQMSSIATTFFITAGTFGAMAVYGSVTKTDLSKVGNLCFMALIGIIIASVVNIFIGNSMMDLIISGIGVLIFVGLTAWDAQKIKAMLYGADENDQTQKIAVLGALTLYLDFVNMFLYLLRLFGNRK